MFQRYLQLNPRHTRLHRVASFSADVTSLGAVEHTVSYRMATAGNTSSKGGKNVLIVYAHPKPESFNGALLRKAVEVLSSKGHNVVVSDLYKMNFDPLVRLEDFSVSDSGPSDVSRDVQEEVDKVERADLVVFQFPLYWSSFPAILKGWMDRVIQVISGFVRKTGFYEEGDLRGKRALLSFTTGAPSIPVESLEAMLLPMQVGPLNMVGFDVLTPQVSLGVENGTEEKLKEYLADWAGRLSTVFEEPTPEMLTVDTWAKKHSVVSE
ncbi:ribosyldihydronicotinamide dehydrogenase [quinone]-like isoform X2 [Haliotis rubra]|uniref:ribosyldihydronicotinamide dehydrogenase [quinone]-like isoform X2 n=1 Tax=Haliotis rubra TaxID=36100 RepID=UPI001EE5D8E9|nr:ribosyldihydronicotinamide dehydrogenase [quinone]-like isoform X2 [Haliotis rubra]